MTYRRRFAEVALKYMDYAREAFEAEEYQRAAVCLDSAYEFAHICELGLPDIDRDAADQEEECNG